MIDGAYISLLHDADPSSVVLIAVRPQLHHLELEAPGGGLVDGQAVGQQGLDHVVDVGLEVGLALLAETQGHVEDHVAGALVPQLELGGAVLNRRMFTFLNISRVRLLTLKNSDRSSAIRSQGLALSIDLTSSEKSISEFSVRSSFLSSCSVLAVLRGCLAPASALTFSISKFII